MLEVGTIVTPDATFTDHGVLGVVVELCADDDSRYVRVCWLDDGSVDITNASGLEVVNA